MKVAILSGGRGTRLGTSPYLPPKPLATIGDQPILWHVIQLYRRQGFHDFVIAIGHRGQELARWFGELARQDPTLGLRLAPHRGDVDVAGRPSSWRVALVDSGEDTANGSRLARLRPWLEKERFLLSWCDGLADVDLSALQSFHLAHGRQASIVAVHPPSRFGLLDLEGPRVAAFREKPPLDSQWINGGFFLLEPQVLDHLAADGCHFEAGPLPDLAAAGELMAFRHEGFWACMDTPADQARLEALWQAGQAPWTGTRAAA